MDFEFLAQFDRRKFKKYLGIYAKRRRQELQHSTCILAEHLGLSENQYRQIEAGKRRLSQVEFENLCEFLQLNEEDLLRIGRVTQAETISQMLRTFEYVNQES